jgi:hypothetical protein
MAGRLGCIQSKQKNRFIFKNIQTRFFMPPYFFGIEGIGRRIAIVQVRRFQEGGEAF